METATGGYLYGKNDPSTGIIEERTKAGKPQNSGCIPHPRDARQELVSEEEVHKKNARHTRPAPAHVQVQPRYQTA